MKLKYIVLCFFTCMSLFSCIQDEAPNAEADITAFSVKDAGDGILDVDIENDKILVWASPNLESYRFAPEFVLTPGATISPESGTQLDFAEPQYYEVTSEDRKWKKKYEVSFLAADIPTEFSFEHYYIKEKTNYETFYEEDAEGKTLMSWASGNPGFAITGMGTDKNAYPTMSSADGYKGNCVKLVTRSTGFFGSAVGMPIAAGNLFLGVFDVSNALTDALKATQMGFPFGYRPVALKGYYKYKSGPVFTENGSSVSGKKDACDIYAFFYETDANLKRVDGTNKFTHPNVVSIARISGQKETDEWTEFNIPFEMVAGKTIDPVKLKNKKYNLGIVFSSSIDGDHFNGAIGSTLLIDEVKLECAVN
ncbi:MAG: PCMD domain-containing protein [Parabacteroides sp.]|nr:PCMD domain-containing protein [Parabacteroides sp.]